MAVCDFHILAQAILYFFAVIAGFVVAIPIGVNRINFKGNCILYADTKWSNNEFLIPSSNAGNCNFPIYFSVFGLIFYGLGLGLYNMYAVIRSRKDPAFGSQMWVIPFMVLNAVQVTISLVVACMVSVGLLTLCNGLTGEGKLKNCWDRENSEFKKVDTGDTFNSGNYYKLLTTAQAGAWIAFLIWIIQLVLSVLRFIRNRRQGSGAMMDKAQAGQGSTTKIAETEPTS
ncbi:transmembrane protein 179-like [Dreissena polymorpha]|uniref:Uncharacterized protein n=1 Tax=Dreissena polymorpha TaxID=45954 RepID=A0A9D4L812_DREPO|nr:transmembrane protein 179-like [Dreissena polymorpha]KAH3853745.1 hypothetical protein DPMN_096277 [Dreissena polymorpha]